MRNLNLQFTLLLLLAAVSGYGQLGFCSGSKGEPIFTENFGAGTTYGPALPPGTTTYTYITGAPNDGFYTLFYHSGLYSTWHYSLDHTPNDTNGKMLVVNANAVTSGDFYNRTVTNLCVNTTFEFSAWLMNVYNPNSNFCGAGEIPINVRFEIWNSAETVLLGSGNTGNIIGTPSAMWQQFAIVFTTGAETSVVLKMKNNGVGGCGNDLAIDDITFSACGDLTTVSSPGIIGDTHLSCTATSIQLEAATQSASAYFYQWQTSSDGTNWTDIAGATDATFQTPTISSLTYFRVKAAQDAANLSNVYCSTASNSFTVSVSGAPNAATSNGNRSICADEAIPPLSVNAPAGTSINWYDAAAGGTLLGSGTSFTPTLAGVYYAEISDTATNCINPTRTPVELIIVALPDVAIFGATSICSGEFAIVSFSGTPSAVVVYSVDGGANETLTLDGSGLASISTPALTSDSTYSLVSVSSAALNSCSRTKNDSITINVTNSLSATISAPALVCYGDSAMISFSGTPNTNVTYTVNGGANQLVLLDSSGSASVTANMTTNTIYTLVEISAGTCAQPLSQSVTITVIPTPSASISAQPLTVCPNQTSSILFSGTPNATIVYSVNGVNHTIALDTSGVASVTTPTLSSNITYMLVSSTSADLTTCTTLINESVTIAVNDPPTATFSSNTPVCYGDLATINFSGTPNATVTFTEVGGSAQTITLDGSGMASIDSPNMVTTTTYSLISVTSAANGCILPLSESITIAVIPLPSVTISANPTTVCSGQTSTISFIGTPNAVVTYAIDGGMAQTLSLNSTGSATIGNSNSSTIYQLLMIALGDCSQTLSDSVTLTINSAPDVIISGDLNYCEGEFTAITLSSGIPGTTFSWTVDQNGTIGAASGSGNQINQSLTLQNDAPGTVVYTVTPIFDGCTGLPEVISITIYPVPFPEIRNGFICSTDEGSSGQFYTLDTNLSEVDHDFEWYYEGNVIANALGSSYDAAEVGTYSVIAINNWGCASDEIAATVSEAPQGESLVITQSDAFSDNPTVIIEVVGGAGPFLYQLDDSMFQSENVFQNVSPGAHTVTVIDSSYCTNLTATITVIGYPAYFTPNGDGHHDTWNVTSVRNAGIRIFDRYGKVIKQITSDGLGWDGTYNGRKLPSTDYWFTIDYVENGVAKIFRAHFALKR